MNIKSALVFLGNKVKTILAFLDNKKIICGEILTGFTLDIVCLYLSIKIGKPIQFNTVFYFLFNTPIEILGAELGCIFLVIFFSCLLWLVYEWWETMSDIIKLIIYWLFGIYLVVIPFSCYLIYRLCYYRP